MKCLAEWEKEICFDNCYVMQVFCILWLNCLDLFHECNLNFISVRLIHCIVVKVHYCRFIENSLFFRKFQSLDHLHTAIRLFQHILVSVLERKYFLQDHDVINCCFYFQLQRFFYLISNHKIDWHFAQDSSQYFLVRKQY